MNREESLKEMMKKDEESGIYKQLTAVEFLEEALHGFIHPEHGKDFLPILEQAKAMEKIQIRNAWLVDGYTDISDNEWMKEFEEYYNETFNK